MEVKFRAKSLESGNWVYGLFHRIDSKPAIQKTNGHSELVREETLTQFTGFYDKIGREVYVGDILTLSKNKEFFGEVVFNYHCFEVCVRFGRGEVNYPLITFREESVVDDIFPTSEKGC